MTVTSAAAALVHILTRILASTGKTRSIDHGQGSLSLGLICAALRAYGGYEFAHELEGAVTYLVLAAPLIAVSAAFIPPIAEATLRAGGYVKALL